MQTPTKVTEAVKNEALSIASYDHRNVNYRGKMYTIHHSVNAGGYYATFTGYRSKQGDNVPVFYTEV